MKKLKIKFNKYILKIKSLLIIIPVVAFSIVGIYIIVEYITFDTSSIKFPTSSIKVFDKNSTLLWEVSKDNAVKTTPIKIKDVPANCVNGIISVEDRYFWSNIGVDLNGTGRLLFTIFTGDNIGGGSTITQQLIKVANERFFSRNPADKLNEIVSAIKLSNSMSKQDVLEMYLNNVFFGNLNYGIESASQDYFKKPAKDLNLAECSYLAGVPQWPGVLNPYGNLEFAKERQKVVLDSMVRDSYITQAEADKALSEDLAFNLTPVEVKAPHYVQFISDLIQKKISSTPNIHTFGDLDLGQSSEIYSTYDYNIHKKSLEIVQNVIAGLKDRNASNASVVILDKDNNLVTMLGSANYFDDTIDGKFNSALGFRQPGTALMPLLYSYSFGKDKTFDTSYPNTNFQTSIERGSKTETINISNFSNYQSPNETLENAFRAYYLIPSVELTKELGKDKISSSFNEFETLFIPERSGCSDAFVTEGCEKDLLDLTYFYSVIKNNGLKVAINTSFAIKKYDEVAKMVIPTGSTTSNIKIGMEYVKQILNQNPSGWSFYNGDTTNYKDVFTLGFNSNYTVGVWLGNTKGEATNNLKAVESSQVVFDQITQYLNNL